MVQVLVLFRVLLEDTGTNFNGSSDGKSGAGWFWWFAAKIWQVLCGTIWASTGSLFYVTSMM